MTSTAKHKTLDHKPLVWQTPDGERVIVADEDDVGDPVRHYRTVSTITRLLNSGVITEHQHAAGEHFAINFAFAYHSDCKTSSWQLARPSGGATPIGLERIERNAHVARHITQVMDAVGGGASPAASALWYVVGLGYSIRAWAQRELWNGRRINQHEARGMLVAALGVLARFYGYQRD